MKNCFSLALHNSSARLPQGQLVFHVLYFTEGKTFNLHFCVREMVLEILILWTCKTFIFNKTGSACGKWSSKGPWLYFYNILEHSFSETLFWCIRVLIRENTGQRNPIFWHILRSGMQQVFSCKYYAKERQHDKFTVNKCKTQ